MVKRVIVIAAIVLGAVLLAVALGGGGGKSDPVTFTEGGVDVRVEFLDSGLAGDRLKVTLKPQAVEGYIAAGVKLDVSGALTPAGEIRMPRPLTKRDVPVPVYATGAARVEVPVQRLSDKPGKVVIKLSYQTCGKVACLPAVTDRTVILDLK